jgi:hypothetical protein
LHITYVGESPRFHGKFNCNILRVNCGLDYKVIQGLSCGLL